MRRPFWLIEGKLSEADFFLDQLRSAKSLDSARYYFSAFVSAARSVTWVMQTCLSDHPQFKNWYEPKQQSLSANPLARFFVEVRNQIQKTGLNPLGGAAFGDTANFYFFSADEIDELDVVTASIAYFSELVHIVHDCYKRFYPSVDFQYASVTELEATGRTIEDFEEELGVRRGWTAGNVTPPERFMRLKAISRSAIVALAKKYSKAELPPV